ncbi:MAG: hypothetical protein KDB14_06485 [Planctomycetales bacterium]|nr:hypothetical protein [Planctomycetales bacterium]
MHRLDDRLAELRKVADQWRRRAIRPGAAETCENDIIAIARKLDCQVRRASLGASGQRPWRRGANPYEELEWQDDVSDEEDEGIVLSTTSLSMTVVGSFEQLQRFLAEVESMDRLIGFDTVELLPGDTSHVELMQIELKLLLFDLDRGVDLAIARDRPDA